MSHYRGLGFPVPSDALMTTLLCGDARHVVDKRSEYSERSGGRGVCFGGGNRGGFGANQIVYGAECGGGSALHRSLNDASESRKCFCAAVVFRTVRKLAGNNGRPHGPFRSIVGRFDGLIAQGLQYATWIVL